MMNEMNNLRRGEDLPDEFALLAERLGSEVDLLAERLGSEADLLAEMYPARAPQFIPTVAISNNPLHSDPLSSTEPVSGDRLLVPMPVWMRWTAAAAVLICAVWGTLGSQDGLPVHDFGTPRGSVVNHLPPSSGPTPVSIEPSPVSRDLYENLTAPAREALLDMWEAEAAPQASLSI